MLLIINKDNTHLFTEMDYHELLKILFISKITWKELCTIDMLMRETILKIRSGKNASNILSRFSKCLIKDLNYYYLRWEVNNATARIM